MRHLVIYSHPNPKSFNHAIKETYVQALRESGQEVRVRDLYALNFDPVLKGSELAGFKEARVPEDIRTEQEHVRWAQVITFICPVWWGGPTANLRGYLDRVFSLGFAYDEASKGLLGDKKVLTIHTLAAPLKVYEDTGLIAAMNKLYDEIVFKFASLQVVGHKYFGSVSTSGAEERQKMLLEVRELGCKIP
jgi:NAD(P)H dehydrogenase (quinone)